MIFSRNTKHLTIFKVTEILTLFLADMPTWVNFISCNSKNRGKIQIVIYMTTYVRLERYGGPCTYCQIDDYGGATQWSKNRKQGDTAIYKS